MDFNANTTQTEPNSLKMTTSENVQTEQNDVNQQEQNRLKKEPGWKKFLKKIAEKVNFVKGIRDNKQNKKEPARAK